MANPKISMLATKDLIPYARNTRTHSDEQVNQIVSSIKEFGFTNPVLVDQDNMIIAGHGRVMAANKLKLGKVPTICLKHLTEAQKKAYIIADNRLALNAGWDEDMLKVELEELNDLEFDISLLGFEDKEIESLLSEPTEGLTDEDAVPDLPEEPTTKLGDLWILGEHRLLCGDSTSIDAVDKLMDGNKADMVFTDPPYGMFLDTAMSERKTKKDNWVSKPKKYDKVIGDHEDFKPELITSILDIDAKEVFIWGADYFAELLPKKNDGSWIVWDKRAGVESMKWSTSEFELCWSKKRHHRKIARITWSGILGTEQEHDGKSGRVHPTQKPTQLAVWFFDNWGADNDLVVDIYLGSGSTLIAAEKTNRKCYGMELDPKYCDVIIQRWEEFTGNKAELSNG